MSKENQSASELITVEKTLKRAILLRNKTEFLSAGLRGLLAGVSLTLLFICIAWSCGVYSPLIYISFIAAIGSLIFSAYYFHRSQHSHYQLAKIIDQDLGLNDKFASLYGALRLSKDGACDIEPAFLELMLEPANELCTRVRTEWKPKVTLPKHITAIVIISLISVALSSGLAFVNILSDTPNDGLSDA
ncbi:MAG: hypothetical protein HRU15_14320, partial [Planctomycetes bacterium]|nr:hypothetical protein [Planctomycetota bacterium]